MPETTQAGPCAEIEEKVKACLTEQAEEACKELSEALAACLAASSGIKHIYRILFVNNSSPPTVFSVNVTGKLTWNHVPVHGFLYMATCTWLPERITSTRYGAAGPGFVMGRNL